MRTMHRHELPVWQGVNFVATYKGAIVRAVDAKGSIICVWLEVETEGAGDILHFAVVGTGVDLENVKGWTYQGTAVVSPRYARPIDSPCGQLVWHVYQKPKGDAA